MLQVIFVITESKILHFLIDLIAVLVGKLEKTLMFKHFAKEFLKQEFDLY